MISVRWRTSASTVGEGVHGHRFKPLLFRRISVLYSQSGLRTKQYFVRAKKKGKKETLMLRLYLAHSKSLTVSKIDVKHLTSNQVQTVVLRKHLTVTCLVYGVATLERKNRKGKNEGVLPHKVGSISPPIAGSTELRRRGPVAGPLEPRPDSQSLAMRSPGISQGQSAYSTFVDSLLLCRVLRRCQ